MAFDISIDASGAAAPEEVAETEFEAFYDSNVDLIATALFLTTSEAELAEHALTEAFLQAARRWKQLAWDPYRLHQVFELGVTVIDKTTRERPAAQLNHATGGYIRGLALTDAIDSLPTKQRAMLVAAYHLGWSDEEIAAGLKAPATTIQTRRVRAESFLRRHLNADEATVRQAVVGHFATIAADHYVEAPTAHQVQRSGRNRTIRDRLVVVAAALALIAFAGILVRGLTSEPEVDPDDIAAPPVASNEWLGPVGDGSGGFVALNIRGAASFIASSNGVDWLEAATWNSKSIDVRTRVSSFQRSGGRYVATIEAAPAISVFVAPHVGVSNNLVDWEVRQILVGELPTVEGLRPQAKILDVTATRTRVLASVEILDVVDYGSFGIRRDDVCAETETASQLQLNLCAGGRIQIPRVAAAADAAATVRFFLREGTGPFAEVAAPPGADPYGLFSAGDRFAMLDSATGTVMTSADGISWDSWFARAEPSRFVLAEGPDQGDVMVIEPTASAWPTTRVQAEQVRAGGEIPITQDPASVWVKPELAHGPAGWALFVTTSRSWERPDATPGWAVETGQWVVSQLPDSVVIVAQAKLDDETIRYRQDGPAVRLGEDGGVTLLRPGTDEVIVAISQAEIEASREQSDGETGEVKARVFFSEEGAEWRVIWESDRDSWLGDVTVGDREVVVSGTQLGDPPIVVPLDS